MARKSDYSNERVRQGVHGVDAALNQYSRVDIASQLISETARIVPPPKKALNIKELTKTTTDKATGQKTTVKYVVLPQKMEGNVIKKDSPEFQELLKDKELLKAYKDGEKAWIKYSDEVDEAMRRNARQIDDLKDTIQDKEDIIVKKEQKIASLSKYRSIVFSVVALIGLLIGIYVLSLFLRLAMAGARMMS
jgi:N12 class adenine-specific DNA methylase